MSEKPEGLYQVQAAKSPSIDTLKTISKDLGFDIPDQELPEYAGVVNKWMEECTLLDELPEPTLPVKYPRTPGYRPSPEENTHNAWYYKSRVVGSESGILAGKKVALKDNIALAGVPMMNGSRLLEGYIPEFDATVTTRILDAGGEIAGKAVCEDLCLSGSSFTTAKAPCLNPVNKLHSAGGSSCGSATLVGLGEVDMALGGDQGGSIRIPGSWCGIVGLKPTYGLVPYTGIVSIEPTVDHVGPMAKTVSDCALLLEAITGYDDGLDPRQRADIPRVDYSKKLSADASGLKVGLLAEGFAACNEGVQEVVRKAVKDFMSAATVEDVSIPFHEKGQQIWGPSCLAGCYNTSITSSGVASGFRGFYATSLGEHMSRAMTARPNDLSVTMKMVCMFGELQKRNYGTKYYSKSVNLGRLLKKAYDDMLDKYDVLVMPTLPTVAPKLPTEISGPKEYADNALHMVKNTSPFDCSGHPALTINAGYLDGLPVGVMFVGKHFDETTVLNAAFAFETARDSGKA